MPARRTRPLPASGRLGQKQSMGQENWLAVAATIRQRVSRDQLDALVDATLDEMRATLARHRWRTVAFAWSGGKDSLVLERLCEAAGIEECVLAITEELEWPAFLQWATDHMPHRLEVISTGQDLAWLAKHPDLLFPQEASQAAEWFHVVQHRAQARYYKARGLDCLLLGRRRSDGNYTGPRGANWYTNREGVTRYSPLRDWSHEDILAFIDYHAITLPPMYGWPNGYRVGTGPWPARQWQPSVTEGWREVYGIDPSVVRAAAPYLPSARTFLEGQA